MTYDIATTVNNLIQDENFLCGLTLPQYNAKVFMTYIGSENVAYKMFYKDSLLFEGTDFRPSPLFGLDSLKSICSLLSSLTTKFGDTDRDYFANYTKDQLLFTETEDCENIRLLLSDFDSKEDDYFQEANEELTKAFIQ